MSQYYKPCVDDALNATLNEGGTFSGFNIFYLDHSRWNIHSLHAFCDPIVCDNGALASILKCFQIDGYDSFEQNRSQM